MLGQPHSWAVLELRQQSLCSPSLYSACACQPGQVGGGGAGDGKAEPPTPNFPAAQLGCPVWLPTLPSASNRREGESEGSLCMALPVCSGCVWGAGSAQRGSVLLPLTLLTANGGQGWEPQWPGRSGSEKVGKPLPRDPPQLYWPGEEG